MVKRMLIAGALLCAAAANAQTVKVTGEAGATLNSLMSSHKLVTVVINAAGAPEDKNLQVIDVQSDYIKFLNEKGESVTYTYGGIQELRVQGGAVAPTEFTFLRNRPLSAEEQEVVDSAWKRVTDLYAQGSRSQDLKILAAGLLAFRGEQEKLDYLIGLTKTNDFATQFDAAKALYISGHPLPQGLLKSGFESGRLDIRAAAARLAGLTGDMDALTYLNTMVQDRAPELSAPAAVALARLGQRDVIPRLFEMIGEINEEKGDAARIALVKLGGDDIIQELKLRIQSAEGKRLMRMLQALFELGDPEAKKQLGSLLSDNPMMAPDAGQLLATAGDYAAQDYVRQRLQRREDPTENNEINRVRFAAALVQGGDPDASAELQNMIRSDYVSVKVLVCDKIAELHKRNLIPALRPAISNVSPAVAYHAAAAAISFSDADFRDRFLNIGAAR